MRIARNIDDVKVLNILHKNCGNIQAHEITGEKFLNLLP